MDDSDYAEVKRHFEAAMDLPEPEREAYLASACGDDPATADRVRSLFESASVSSSLDALLEEPPAPAGTPEHIAGYRILRIAGRGGMGTVYEAEQASPRRRVALKVVDPGHARENLLRRFDREAEVLARLQHPGIAQIYGAGTFEGGAGPQPFFAMEFVQGRSLVDHANEQGLDRTQRLRLVISIAEAVAYAHAQGVIHRDLKPANILVDPTGQPKVLDFGVARVANDEVSHVTLETSAGQLVGTLPYMSPEQASAEPGRLDERTDVYSIGVILYELLTGELPLPMRGSSVQEALRSLHEEDPLPLASFDRSLRGDLETIVSKALAKEKERRYLSAEDLAADIGRYLANEPIFARPTSVMYQFAKFTRRNRGLVVGLAGGVVVAITALAVALGMSLENARVLRRSEARAVRAANRSAIAAAAAALELGATDKARAQLAGVTQEGRTWEWGYYSAQIDNSLASFDTGEPIAAMAFSGDSTSLVVADVTGRIRRWDPDKGAVTDVARVAARLPDPFAADTHIDQTVAFDARATRLAACLGDDVVVWDALTGTELARLGRPAGAPAIALSPDGRTVAVDDESGLVLWNPSTGEVRRLTDQRFDRLDFAEDGLLAAARYGVAPGGIFVFDPSLGAQCGEVVEKTRCYEIALVDGGEACYSTRIDDKKQARRYGVGAAIYEGHTLTPRALTWNQATRRVASGGSDTTVCVWSAQRPSAPEHILHGHTSSVDRVVFSSTGERLAASSGTTIRTWGLDSKDRQIVLEHPHAVYTVDFLPSGHLMSTDWKGLVRTWSRDGQLTRERQLAKAGSRLSFTPDLRWYARQHWERLVLFDEGMNEVKRARYATRLTDVSLARDASLLATRLPSAIHVVSVPDLEPVFDLDCTQQGETSGGRFGAVLLTGPGDRLLAQDGSGDLVAWSMPSGEELFRLPGMRDTVTRLAESPDGRLVAAGCASGPVWLWDLETQQCTGVLTGHTSRVYALAFHPHSGRLATGSNDTTLRIWDLDDGAETALFSVHTDFVYDLAFSDDGLLLASASGDGTVRLWDAAPRRSSR